MGQWDERLIDQASDVPSIIFSHNFLQNSLQKFFQFTSLFFKKSCECTKSIRNYEKNNAWNIRHLVNESFVTSTHRPSILY